jgi:DNA-binding winged helix-turn-helix (wHTH) protein/TolB-like protein
MSDSDPRVVYEFGSYRADPLTRRLYGGGEPLAITPKAFETLLVLIAKRGDVVLKSDLIDAVWAETAVEENNLTQQIAALRRAFGERAGDHRFIVTIPGKGYSFVAPVSEIEIAADEELVVTHATRSTVTIDVSAGSFRGLRSLLAREGAFGGMIALAYIFLVCFLAAWPHFSGAEPRQTVAVLDFRTAASEDVALGAGIRDTLRARLGSLEDVAVRPPRSGIPGDDALIAGRRLDADVVLTGSVQREEDRVRVVIELVDIRRERVVWGQTFDRDRSELFELQDAIAGEAVRVIKASRLGAPS